MAFLPMHDFVISCFGHLENSVSLSYSDFPNVYAFYGTARTTKSHLLISPLISSKKVFKYWEVGNLWEQIQFFQNSNTCLKARILLLASIQLVVVFEVTGSLWSCELSSKHHSIWINIVSVAVILLSKKVIPWKKKKELV